MPSERCSDALPCLVQLGAIWSKADIDAGLVADDPALPQDELGHGTHVAGIAAASLVEGSPYRGVAPAADLVVVKSSGAAGFDNASLIRACRFVYDRAAEQGSPAVLNLSLTGDFTPHDGTDLLADVLASEARGPGRILVAAAGNEGNPGTTGVHQSVEVSERTLVPIMVQGNLVQGVPSFANVDILVTPRPGASIDVGLRLEDGAWVLPVGFGEAKNATIGEARGNVIYDPAQSQGLVPAASRSALVALRGKLTPGRYFVELVGSGHVDLRSQGAGYFEFGVREETIGSPAYHPHIIAVGSTAHRTSWRDADGEQITFDSNRFDEAGGLLLGQPGTPVLGQVNATSAAGPGLGGVLKPDVMAPGTLVASAAATLHDGTRVPVFGKTCLRASDRTVIRSPNCSYVDQTHAVLNGTSMAAPMVAGAIAVMLQADPALTQQGARLALQGGAHHHRGPALYPEQASVGELDLAGSLRVLEENERPTRVEPLREESWMSPSSHYAVADGSRPLEVLYSLKGPSRAPADGFFFAEFAVSATLGGAARAPIGLERLGPGLWRARFAFTPEDASGSVHLTATFGGAEIVAPVDLPVAFDPWQARYPSKAVGNSCAAGRPGGSSGGAGYSLFLLLLLGRKRRS